MVVLVHVYVLFRILSQVASLWVLLEVLLMSFSVTALAPSSATNGMVAPAFVLIPRGRTRATTRTRTYYCASFDRMLAGGYS